ncbi:MAG: PP2C family protein-serine/threonine phosphatase, partial [Planctomycetota bacterium]
MSCWNIAVISHARDEELADQIRKRILQAWDSTPRAAFPLLRHDELDESRVETLDAAVIVAEANRSDAAISHSLATLEEMHVPVLALVDETPKPGSVFEISGALVDGRKESGPVLSARLHGMLHRQREVNLLRRDLAVATRAEGGLWGEVARIQDELHLAAQAQREFLPRELTPLHGVSFAALWRPAAYVSGDIYDVCRLDDDHLGLFVADAVGHGVAAALMTMVIIQSLTTRSLDGAERRIMPPGEVLRLLNERLPLLVHGDGRCETLKTNGGLLGVFDDETYDQIEVELAVEDRLLLYTDGFEQAFPSSSERPRGATERYRHEFEELCALGSPQEMVESVNHRLDVQSGSLHQVDDMTLVCMHAGPLVPAEPL